ncbi:hypothetical protein [Qingshengfaniella alkalisoli]|uniref:Uncharacterized protein n=1 Tax=Qingshengfaniella alkalisoli TaxID=2599296 RepID=A0A5B8IV09_9RHOB|nr:hypothetical protein [Qingshengfaniella alkalisoli]QDY69952.1 hypothetical protein FPZ52_10210 [Qingshengfaniella alkalisoli]
MPRHIIDTPPLRSGERVRAYLRIARREHSFPERQAIFRNAGKSATTKRIKEFLRIERGKTA